MLFRSRIATVPRSTLLIWMMALAATAITQAFSGTTALTREALIGAALITPLLCFGDSVAVELDGGYALSPVPALLIAGLIVVGWPLLSVAAVAGTLCLALLRRRPLAAALRVAGARGLVVAIITPIYHISVQQVVFPFSTPLALIGLLCAGMIAYAVELITRADHPERGSVRRYLHVRFGAIRWYVLAMIPLGGLLGALWSVSPWAFLLGLAPLTVAQQSFRAQIALRQTTADFAQLAVQREALATRLERLQALATTMIGTLNVQTMLELLCERLAALLDAPSGWVVLMEEGNQPRLMAAYHLPVAKEAELGVDAASYAELVKRETVMLFTDERRITLAPRADASPAAHWPAVLSIPLAADQHVLGVICLAFGRLRGLDVDDQRVLTSFAKQAAMAIENARLFNEVRRKQAELIQSSKLAAVGTFAAGIAHEFNNLLGGMLGYAQLGARSLDVTEKEHALDVVIQTCLRGSSITRGLLTFARQEERRRIMADVTDAINDTLMLVALNLRQSNIKVIKQLEPVPPTLCDLGQIAQVVLNLITNARDAMQPDGGTLTIRLRERSGTIELSVTDTGCGIPEEMRDKIFDPFVTTKGALGGSDTPGTGLGLSISYGIVRDHGGTIEVQSTPGNGTTMTICLPVVTEVEEPALAAREYGS